MKLLLMADGQVGLAITRWLLREFREDIALIVATAENEVWRAAQEEGVPCVVFKTSEHLLSSIGRLGIELDIGILAWWPKIIEQSLLNKPRRGFINTHPSYLPYNRGKHYNFWALVEQTPFGVSLHMVDGGIDSGDIIAQKNIPYGWEDNGETLYAKAREAMLELFRDSYPAIRGLDFPRAKQELQRGSFHKATELGAASRIEIDGTYCARDLFNVLRARTFTGHPSCWFKDGDDEFEVRVVIKRKKS
jgi:methionyl-tRNA formyltransferase